MAVRTTRISARVDRAHGSPFALIPEPFRLVWRPFSGQSLTPKIVIRPRRSGQTGNQARTPPPALGPRHYRDPRSANPRHTLRGGIPTGDSDARPSCCRRQLVRHRVSRGVQFNRFGEREQVPSGSSDGKYPQHDARLPPYSSDGDEGSRARNDDRLCRFVARVAECAGADRPPYPPNPGGGHGKYRRFARDCILGLEHCRSCHADACGSRPLPVELRQPS